MQTNNGVQPHQKTDQQILLVDKLENVVSFQNLLATAPPQNEVKVNKAAGNSSYLPISFVENKLDEIFSGLWQTKNFHWQVIANEIVGNIELGVYHPVIGQWLWREGAAGTMIQQKQGSDITDISAKHKNTLVKDFPHLKAECLKNAAKSLGKAFGRDLNREFEDSYTPIHDTAEAQNHMAKIKRAKNTKEAVQYVKESGLSQNVEVAEYLLKICQTQDEVNGMFQSFKDEDWYSNSIIVRKATERIAAIKKGK